MCLILLAYRVHPRYPLILAANRDEFYDRPSVAAGFWTEYPDLYGGRDLVHGGTWLGVTRQGRLAALTNYRDPLHVVPNARSRGELVTSFLSSGQTPEAFLTNLGEQATTYNGFNLLLGDAAELSFFSNRTGKTDPIRPGIHGLSNHLLNTPWPKVARGKELLSCAVAAGEILPEALFAILADRQQAPDGELPSTGVGLEWERLLSSIFIVSPGYGTRASTVILIDERQRVTFVERTFVPAGDAGTREIRFNLDATAGAGAEPRCRSAAVGAVPHR